GEVIVADARLAQRGILRPGPAAQMPRSGGEPHEAFQHAGNVVAGEREILVPALLARAQQSARIELGQMRARRLHGDARLGGQFRRRHRFAAHQRGQHVGARGIADEGRDPGDVRAFFHSSILVEALTRGKRLGSIRPGAKGGDMTARHIPKTELFLLALLALLWGSSYLFTKIAVAEIPPITLIAFRVTGAAVFLSVVLAWRNEKLPRDARTWRMLFLQSLFNSIAAWTLLAWGQQFVDAGLASVLNSTSPLFVFLFTALVTRHETLGGLKLLGAVVGCLGVVLIVGVDTLRGLG